MNEYIRKEDAIAIAESYNVEGFNLNDYEYGRDQVASSIASDLEDVKPADVVEVKHGEWISECEPHYECSECHHWFHLYQYMNYCPYCGAKMDGKE